MSCIVTGNPLLQLIGAQRSSALAYFLNPYAV